MCELKELCDSCDPSATHKLLAFLHASGRIQGWFTQNIDGLEDRLGLDPGDVVKLHGSLRECKCSLFNHVVPWEEQHTDLFKEGFFPDCQLCIDTVRSRPMRSCIKSGQLLPNVLLYGDNHPESEQLKDQFQKCLNNEPDLLLVIGTSLSLQVLNEWIRATILAVNRNGGKSFYVNLTRPPKYPDFNLFCHISKKSDNVFLPILEELRSKELKDHLTPLLMKKPNRRNNQNGSIDRPIYMK